MGTRFAYNLKAFYNSIFFSMPNYYPYSDLCPILAIWPWPISQGHSSHLNFYMVKIQTLDKFNPAVLWCYSISSFIYLLKFLVCHRSLWPWPHKDRMFAIRIHWFWHKWASISFLQLSRALLGKYVIPNILFPYFNKMDPWNTFFWQAEAERYDHLVLCFKGDIKFEVSIRI